jgi:2-oxoglutarate ferredoxin oxidoreductase subunit gamma
MILAGVILAEAVGIYDGKNVAQTQSYGPEARGGASRSDVVISDEEIDYPKAVNLDILLALTQQSYDSYQAVLKDTGMMIYDSSTIKPIEEKTPFEQHGYPIIAVAREYVGREIVANIVALGVITEKTGIVSKKAIEQAVLNRVPKGTESFNMRALETGYLLAQGRELI